MDIYILQAFQVRRGDQYFFIVSLYKMKQQEYSEGTRILLLEQRLHKASVPCHVYGQFVHEIS